MNKLFTRIMASVAGFAMAIGVGVGIGSQAAKAVYAEEEVYYTLTPASGSNNAYASSCDVVIDGITWNVTGNSTTDPWRIGGKSLNGVNRTVYSKTAMSSAITKVELKVGSASSITVNSLKLVAASNSGFSANVDEVSETFTANSTITFTPSSGENWATGSYYKFVFNVTVSGTSNKYVEFTEAKFYREKSGGDTPTTYTVTYDANGGTGSMTDPDSPYNSGSTVTVLDNEFTRDGYNFVNFNTAEDGSGSDYDEGDTFTISGNTTLYAQWEEDTAGIAWVYTPMKSLIASDTVVIFGDNGSKYAMSNDNGASNPPLATALTVENGRLSASPATEIRWDVDGSRENGYTFYPSGSSETWLYTTNTNNGVRVGTNDNKVFTVASNGYLQNSATDRYIGIYSSQDWRCYTSTSTNIDGQTFGAYRRIQDRVLSNITISGTYPTEFTQGDAFSSTGLTVTANYTDSTTEDVTERAIISGYDTINGSGNQTVQVSYTEGSVVDVKEYTISVNPATMYTITATIANGSISNTEDVREGTAFNATISAIAKYNRPEELTVTMGGNALTLDGGYTYDVSNGAFSITSVTGNVVIEGTCEKTHGIWIDVPYTIAEAKAAIDSNGNKTGVYVKGIISQVDSYSSTYKSITYWISADGTTSDQFEVYSGKDIGKGDFADINGVRVGAEVIIKGNIKLYTNGNNSTYEFDKNNELVFYSGAVLDVTETDGVVNSVTMTFNTKISKDLWNTYGSVTEYGMMLFKTQKNVIPTVEERYNSDPNKDTNPTKVLVVNGDYGITLDEEEEYYSLTVDVNNIAESKYAYKYCAAPYVVVGGEHNFLANMVCSVNSLADAGIVKQALSEAALNSLKSAN